MFGNKVGHLGRVGSLTLAQRVSAMFSRGEPGAWYDPSDMSTLFQDSAGSTPVTAVEQPVGRMLDKSGRGNHAIQATTTKRPVLSRRVNSVLGSEQWNKMPASDGASTVTEELIDRPSFLNAVSVARVTKAILGNGNWHQYQISQPVTKDAINTRSFFIKPIEGCLSVRGHTSLGDPFYFDYNLQTGVMEVGANAASATVTQFPDGWYRFTVTQKAVEPNTSRIFVIVAAGVVGQPGVFLSTGYDSRLATDAHLPYQRVNTATDYDADPAKFPAYLRFDGVDDAMVTVGNINFTSTDKLTVWAGVTKLSDAAAGLLLESSYNVNDNSGSFYIAAPEYDGASNFSFRSRGSLGVTPVILFGNAAPISRVVAAIGDIGGDISTIRAGGASNTSPVDQGDGSYGNYPLYICARAGTSLYFNGRLYSLIVRGAQSSLSQIEATEAYIKQKMRLP